MPMQINILKPPKRLFKDLEDGECFLYPELDAVYMKLGLDHKANALRLPDGYAAYFEPDDEVVVGEAVLTFTVK